MEAKDELLISVGYSGAEAIDKFGADLDKIPQEFQAAIRALTNAAGGEDDLFRAKGEAVVKAYVAGMRIQAAQAQGLLKDELVPSFDSDAFVNSVASAMKLSAKETETLKAVLQQTRNELDQLLRPIAAQADLGALVKNLQGVEAANRAVAQSAEQAAAAQRKLANTPTALQKDVEAVRTAPVSQKTRENLAQAITSVYNQRDDLIKNTQSGMKDAGRTAKQQSVFTALARNPDATNTQIAGELGVSRDTVRRVRNEYESQIAASRELTRAWREAKAELKDFLRQPGSTDLVVGPDGQVVRPGTNAAARTGDYLPGRGRSVFDVDENERFIRNPDAYRRVWAQMGNAPADLDYIFKNLDEIARDRYKGNPEGYQRLWQSFDAPRPDVDYILRNIYDTAGATGRTSLMGDQRQSVEDLRRAREESIAGFQGRGKTQGEVDLDRFEMFARRGREAAYALELADMERARNDQSLRYDPDPEFRRFQYGSNARQARLEAADLEAARRTGLSASELEVRNSEQRLRIERNIAALKATPVTAPTISGARRALLTGTPLSEQFPPLFGSSFTPDWRGLPQPDIRWNGGGAGGFRDSFMAGFGGPQDRGMGEQLGQTARIALLYGTAYRALALLQQGMEAAVQETLEYESALTNLNIVTGRARAENDGLAQALGNIATTAGFAPSVGVQLGSQALGLYGVASADQATQERTIEISAAVATRMARVSGGDAAATQTQIAGALRSLNWGPERLTELEDTVSFISRQTGQAPMELLGAMANVQTLGAQSGFTPQQIAALLAQVGTTTGQNPEGTAGQFRQLLSQNAAIIVPRAESILGADLKATNLSELFTEVAAMDLNADQLNRFSSLFGKGGSQQVATILTQQMGTINELATGAGDAQGFGRDAFEQAMSSFGARMQELGAQFADFGVTLIETGILDWLALVVVATRELLEVGTGVLDLFNSLPRPLRAVALALGEIYAASLIMTRLNIAGARTGGTAVGRAAQAVATLTPFGFRQMAANSQGPVMPNGAFISNQTRASMPAWLGVNPFARSTWRLSDQERLNLATNGSSRMDALRARTGLTTASLVGIGGGIVAAGAMIGTGIDVEMQADARLEEIKGLVAAARSLEDLRNAAAAARNALEEIEAQGIDGLRPGDVTNLLPAIMTTLLTGGERAELERQEALAQERADRQEAAQKQLVDDNPARAFENFTAEGIAAGMETLTERGFDAEQRLRLLNEAMFNFSRGAVGMTDAVATIKANEIPAVSLLASGAGTNAFERIRQFVEIDRDAADFGGSDGQSEMDRQNFQNLLNTMDLSADDKARVNGAMEEVINAGLQQFADDGVITEEERATIIDRAIEAAKQNLPEGAWNSVVAAGYEELFGIFLGNDVKGAIGSVGGGELTRAGVTDYLRNLPALAQAGAENVERRTGSAAAGRAYNLQQLLGGRAEVLAQVAESGQPMTEEERNWLRQRDLDIVEAKRAVAQDRLASIQALNGYRAATLLSDDVLGRLDLQQQGIDTDRRFDVAQTMAPRMVGGLLMPGMPTQEFVQREFQRRSEEEGIKQAKQAERLAASQNRIMAGVRGGDSIGAAAAQVASASLALSTLTEGSSQWWAAQGQLVQSQYAYTQSVVQAQNANRLAKVDPRDDLARLRTQVANTRAEMALLPSNQRGALQDQLNQFAQQEREIIVGRANALASANIAGNRSGIAQAQVSIANAQRTLSLQLPGTEAYYNALSELRQAQASLGDAELAQADRVRRLRSDLTDPVEQARLAVQAARDRLQQDINTGQGSDVIAQSELDVRSAENAAEQAAFQQRISDLQTAEDLGRISHSAYMSYLQSEHDRLTAIADRTRQQQDQLDQVDKLMKSAAEELQGQFNIGDIDLPTIYEVRRAMGAGSPTQVADYSNSNNVVNINGAPLEQVIEYLQQYLGAGAQVVTATAGRKY